MGCRLAAAPARGDQRVAQQQAMVIGPTPPGTGRDGAGDALRLGKSNIADQPQFAARHRNSIDADIDDRSARFDSVAAHDFRPATAATTISARRRMAGMSRLFE